MCVQEVLLKAVYIAMAQGVPVDPHANVIEDRMYRARAEALLSDTLFEGRFFTYSRANLELISNFGHSAFVSQSPKL